MVTVYSPVFLMCVGHVASKFMMSTNDDSGMMINKLIVGYFKVLHLGDLKKPRKFLVRTAGFGCRMEYAASRT